MDLAKTPLDRSWHTRRPAKRADGGSDGRASVGSTSSDQAADRAAATMVARRCSLRWCRWPRRPRGQVAAAPPTPTPTPTPAPTPAPAPAPAPAIAALTIVAAMRGFRQRRRSPRRGRQARRRQLQHRVRRRRLPRRPPPGHPSRRATMAVTATRTKVTAATRNPAPRPLPASTAATTDEGSGVRGQATVPDSTSPEIEIIGAAPRR